MPINLLGDNDGSHGGRVNLLEEGDSSINSSRNIFSLPSGKREDEIFKNKMKQYVTKGLPNFGKGILEGIDIGNQNIAELLTGKKAPSGIPDFLKVKEGEGQPGANEIGKYLPLLMMGTGGGIPAWALRTAVASGYGAIQEPENRAKGALQAGAVQAAVPAVAPVLNAIIKGGANLWSKAFPKTPENIVKAINESPEQISKSITNMLGGGAKNVEESGQKLAKIVNESSRSQEKLAIDEYLNPLLKSNGNDIVFKSVPDLKLPINDQKIMKLFDGFKKNPTLENAQTFQSELRRKAIRLKNLPGSGELEYQQADTLHDYANNVLDKMGEHFKSLGGKAYKQYQAFRHVYSKEFKPYQNANNKIAKMASGDVTNPESPHLGFKYPGNKLNKKGDELTSDINIIREHMPKKFNDLILFSKVGGHQPAEPLHKAITNALNKGYSQYATPELKQQFKALEEAITKRKELADLLKEEEKTRRRSNKIGKTLGTALGLGGLYEANELLRK